MQYLVLGGTGFMGQEVSLRLADMGRPVTVLSPSAGQKSFSSPLIRCVQSAIDQTEILADEVSKADCIIHFVSTTHPKTASENPLFDIASNLLPLVQLLEILKAYPSKKLVFCSSGGTVYGSQPGAMHKETDTLHPATSYGIVKMAMEKYIHSYHLQYGLPYLIVRPANVYGNKQGSLGKQGIISTLISNALSGKPTHIWSSLDNIRDYIYIKDFSDALLRLLDQCATGIFNIGSGKGYSLREIISAVAAVTGKEVPVVTADRLFKDEAASVLDISALHHATGFTPHYSLEEGIRAILAQVTSTSAQK